MSAAPRVSGVLPALLFGVLGGAVLTGCEPTRRMDAGPISAYAQIRDGYNERIAGIDRLWARSTVQVRSRDADGDEREDQGEGWVQYVEPDRVAVQVGKYVDRMYFHLGSDADRYWWIDALDDDERVALVGEHARATPEAAAEFGVPVHPLDLIELLAITPLPESVAEPARWNEDRDAWLVEYPARFGVATVAIDPVTFEARGVVLRDGQGRVAAASELSRYRTLRRFSPGLPGSVAGQIEIELPTLETDIRIDLNAPESNPRRPRAALFDLDRLLRYYKVDRVVTVEELAEARRQRGRGTAEP